VIGYPSVKDGAVLPVRNYLPAVSRKKIVIFFHMINPLLTKPVRSRWLDINLVLFLKK